MKRICIVLVFVLSVAACLSGCAGASEAKPASLTASPSASPELTETAEVTPSAAASPTSSPTPVPTPTPAPTPAPTPSPAPMSLKDMETSYGLVEAVGFTVPSSWYADGDMTEIYYYVLDGPGEGAAMLHVNANWLLGADDTALPDEIVQKYIDGYISAYADNSSFKREAATVAGLEGIRVFCIMEDDYAHDMFIFSDGMVVYTFSFMAYQEEYYLYEGIFNEILNSIQIGDGEAP